MPGRDGVRVGLEYLGEVGLEYLGKEGLGCLWEEGGGVEVWYIRIYMAPTNM